MRNYENLVIVKPTLTAEEIQSTVAAVEEVITSNGGEIAATHAMGMRKLAYPINKSERGYYHVVYYKSAPSAIAEIERKFRINEELLRFATIKYDTNSEIKAWHKLVDKANNVAPAAKEETVVASEDVAETAVTTEEVAATVEAE